MHLAQQEKYTGIITYNHGLIADINRALHLVRAKQPNLKQLPVLKTRYSFFQDIFINNFGQKAEQKLCASTNNIAKREQLRVGSLIASKNLKKPDLDFIFIDEGQDWDEQHRDIIFRLFDPGQVVVADGVDQFVDQRRCNWDCGDITINRRHYLRSSQRTKAATCQTVAEIARACGLSDWDIVPNPKAHGGRVSVIFQRNPQKAVEQGLLLLEEDLQNYDQLKAVDNLVCLPTPIMANNTDYAKIFDKIIAANGGDTWRGFDETDRRIYPISDKQLRAVRYQSCRGMEGWATFCVGLDQFFSFQSKHPRIDINELEETLRQKEGFLLTKELFEQKLAYEKRLFAVNWLMIPLTRSIDHLIIHIQNEKSELANILKMINLRTPGVIEWVNCESNNK